MRPLIQAFPYFSVPFEDAGEWQFMAIRTSSEEDPLDDLFSRNDENVVMIVGHLSARVASITPRPYPPFVEVEA